MKTTLEKFTPYALALLRIVSAYMFMLHGTAKFFEFPVSMTNGNGPVALASIYGVGGILEIGGGLLLLFGLFTRATAFLLSGMMAYAYFFIHTSTTDIFLPLVNNGELALLYSVVFFLLFFVGGGAFALDNRRIKSN